MTDAPNWRDLVIDELTQPTARKRRSIGVNFPPEQMGPVAQAAKKRGMSTAAFLRRAALAVAAHDLGLDWGTLMESEPGIRTYDHKVIGEGDEPPRGRGHGGWIIEGMSTADGE